MTGQLRVGRRGGQINLEQIPEPVGLKTRGLGILEVDRGLGWSFVS